MSPFFLKIFQNSKSNLKLPNYLNSKTNPFGVCKNFLPSLSKDNEGD